MTMTLADPCAEDELQRYDVVPRKVHQYAMIVLIAAGYVAGATVGAWLLFIAAVCMALGRFWRPFDPFRVLTTAVLQPAGLLPRRMVHEDRETRRIARVLGGIVFCPQRGAALAAPRSRLAGLDLDGTGGRDDPARCGLRFLRAVPCRPPLCALDRQ